MLNENDFSFDDEVSIATLNGDVEKVEAEILSDPEEMEKMSLSYQKKSKDALSNLRDRVMLTVDRRKLSEAQKIFDSLENIGDIFSDPDIIKAVRDNTKTAQDLKFLSEAYSRLLESQQKLIRLDSIGPSGNASELNLAIQFKGSNGNEVQAVINAKG